MIAAIFLDNSKVHISKEIKKMSREIGMKLIIHIPRYSPGLNPLEQIWKRMKGFLSLRVFNMVEEIEGVVKEFYSILTRDDLRSYTGVG